MIELEGQKYSGYASAEKADRVSLMLLLAEAIIFAAGANGKRIIIKKCLKYWIN